MPSSEENKPAAPTQTVAAKVTVIRANLEKKKGKPGFNPTLWEAEKLSPLIKEFNRTKSPESSSAILSLSDDPDCNSKQWDVEFGGTPIEVVVVSSSGK